MSLSEADERASLRVRRPNDRHFLTRLRITSRIKRLNSLIEPWVDVANDMDAINRGLGNWKGRFEVEIHGRVYGVHENGTAFPIEGRGIIRAGRGVYAALLILRRYNGVNVQSEFQIAHEAGISDEDRFEAIRLWHIRLEALAHEPGAGN